MESWLSFWSSFPWCVFWRQPVVTYAVESLSSSRRFEQSSQLLAVGEPNQGWYRHLKSKPVANISPSPFSLFLLFWPSNRKNKQVHVKAMLLVILRQRGFPVGRTAHVLVWFEDYSTQFERGGGGGWETDKTETASSLVSLLCFPVDLDSAALCMLNADPVCVHISDEQSKMEFQMGVSKRWSCHQRLQSILNASLALPSGHAWDPWDDCPLYCSLSLPLWEWSLDPSLWPRPYSKFEPYVKWTFVKISKCQTYP